MVYRCRASRPATKAQESTLYPSRRYAYNIHLISLQCRLFNLACQGILRDFDLGVESGAQYIDTERVHVRDRPIVDDI